MLFKTSVSRRQKLFFLFRVSILRDKIMKKLSKFSKLSLALLTISVAPVYADSIQLEVKINNIAPSNGATLTPVWVGFHDGSFDSYNAGEPSSPAIEAIAEDGNTDPITSDFSTTAGGVQGVVLGDQPPLITPGASGTTTVTVESDGNTNRYFSYASMVLPSSDYFVANGDPLTHDISSLLEGSANELSFFIGAPGTIHDAGTEVNDFDTSAGNGLFAALQAGQAGPNQGADENGVITNVENPFANFLNTPAGLDLSGLDFNNYENGIAQVTITTVPIPAALPLAASGFSLLFGVSRLRRKSELA